MACILRPRAMMLSILLTAVILHPSADAAVHRSDSCPFGVKAGDVKYYTNCQMCSCSESRLSLFSPPTLAWSCQSCGAVYLEAEAPCYVTKAQPYTPYPTCCETVRLCPGDDGYDATYFDRQPASGN